MYTELLGDVRFYRLLLKVDGDTADRAREENCPRCGGALHSAPYARKPRGSRCVLPIGYDRRFSLCCSVEGCRGRQTPPSVRFLGRRVYLAGVVVLASAMQNGLTPRRAARLTELLGASTQALARWRAWWMEAFKESTFWVEARARFSPPVDEGEMPSTLLQRFIGDSEEKLLGLLRLLSPLSTTAGYVADRRT